jgi:hypothetical protein
MVRGGTARGLATRGIATRRTTARVVVTTAILTLAGGSIPLEPACGHPLHKGDNVRRRTFQAKGRKILPRSQTKDDPRSQTKDDPPNELKFSILKNKEKYWQRWPR